MAKIFISYRRVDSNAITSRIYDRLTGAFGDKTVFKDVNSLPLGRDFRGVLREATAECRVMLVVIGADWVNAADAAGKRRLDNPDDFVRLEVETGLQREEILVIPLLVEGAQMPKAEDLPESMRELVYNNAFTIHDDPLFHRDLDSLIAAIHDTLGRKRLPTRWLALATTLLTIGVIAGALLLSRSGGGTTGIPTNTLSVSPPAVANNPSELPHPIVALSDMPQTSSTSSQTSALTLTASAVQALVAQAQTYDAQVTASFEAFLTQRAAGTATQYSLDSTATATLWTPTPTATQTLPPLGFPGNPVTSNEQWKPYIDQYARVIGGIEMELVPVGCFNMGSVDGNSDELPVKQQCFNTPFYISRYEITNIEFFRLGCSPKDSFSPEETQLPRASITWFEASTCAASVAGGRLPTEAEWEYAARGPDDLIYPWGNDWNPDDAVWAGNSNNHAADVGSKLVDASWVGAYDMAGNVWEWVSTIYDQSRFPYPYSNTDNREDTADKESMRVARGAAFDSDQYAQRATTRNGATPNTNGDVLGFRVVCDLPAS